MRIPAAATAGLAVVAGARSDAVTPPERADEADR